MSTRDEAQPRHMLARLLAHLREQLSEVAREYGHAALCCPRSSNRTSVK
jgi:hypothetical protein